MQRGWRMDDIVQAAMAKWPNVPDCRGWLGLDARGRWWMRDQAAQSAGSFHSAWSVDAVGVARGSVLTHDKLIAFIGRNYQCNKDGCWYFQNGPQRVFVELALAPWVLRVGLDGRLTTHTGLSVEGNQACTDEHGHLYVATTAGLGLVHSLDMAWAAEQIDRGAWALQTHARAELPSIFGFVLSPETASGA